MKKPGKPEYRTNECLFQLDMFAAVNISQTQPVVTKF